MLGSDVKDFPRLIVGDQHVLLVDDCPDQCYIVAVWLDQEFGVNAVFGRP